MKPQGVGYFFFEAFLRPFLAVFFAAFFAVFLAMGASCTGSELAGCVTLVSATIGHM